VGSVTPVLQCADPGVANAPAKIPEQPRNRSDRKPTRTPNCAIQLGYLAAMNYLPTFRLGFSDGTFNEYRLNQNQLEFFTANGTWRVVSDEDLNLHHILHTEVSKWLTRHLTDGQRSGTR